MSIEAPITEADGWFVGEDKTLRWPVQSADDPDVLEDVTGWTMEWTLRHRRSDAEPIVTLPVAIVNGAEGLVQVVVTSAVSGTLEGDTYHYVLRRVDEGMNQVLAFGPAVIRKAELA